MMVGGYALTEALRKQMSYAAHGDTMSNLVEFASVLMKPGR